jgi:uncharacterized protein YciI
MPIFCATYEYTDDTGLRDQVRPSHRDWLAAQANLLASGPTDAGGAVLIFEGDSAGQVDRQLDDDPIVIAGAVAVKRVVGWKIVRGSWLEALGLTNA